MHDLIIIGAGPAGISAGLYAKRANINVLIINNGKSDLVSANQIDNYYGFENGISGETLYSNGITQAKNLGIEILEEEVLDIQKNENEFKVTTTVKEYRSSSVIISTGNKKLRPNIPGIREFEGKGISYCAICDGFFYKDKNVCVIGNGSFAINEAQELKHIANKVTVLSNGKDKPDTDQFEIIEKNIKSINGEDRVQNIEFEDGDILEVDGLFIAIGEAGGTDFAKRIGIMINGDNIRVNEKMETNIPGLYACGNITGGLLQVSKAVYEGAVAGINAAQYVRGLK